MSKCVHWIFGRGSSIGCNLKWGVPTAWDAFARDEKIEMIKKSILFEMENDKIDTSSFRLFLKNLEERTADGWRHRFTTTNWDFLLEKEIEALKLKVLPPWMASNNVYHLNGTAEEHMNPKYLSPFLLEEDKYSQRDPSPEANDVFNFMLWDTLFVVVGMSFECESDRFLLSSLNRVQDEVPIGKSWWLVLNPSKIALEASSSRIATALPRSRVRTKDISFEGWIKEGMGAMVELGVFAF